VVELFANNAHGTLSAGIGTGNLSLSLNTGQGALFPNPGSGEFFRCTLERLDLTAREVIYVTARSGDTFAAIQRGKEGDAPATFSAGDRVRLRPTRGMLESIAAILDQEVTAMPIAWAGQGGGNQSEWGVNFTSSGGTLDYPVPTNASLQSSMPGRTNTATLATTITGYGIGATQCRVWRGNGTNRGGFDRWWRFALLADLAGMYGYWGLDDTNSFTYTGGTPGGRTTRHQIGVGFDNSSSPGGNFFLFLNDGSAPVSAIDTGIPRNTTDVFELRLNCLPNASSIQVTFKNLATGAVFEFTASTNIPSNAVLLSGFSIVSGVVGAAVKLLGYWGFNVNQSEVIP
jgi:hypothetical protein